MQECAISGDPEYVIQDSGKREDQGTGALRDSRNGKGRFDLITPFMLDRLAKWYELGARKYSSHNWEQGISVSRCIDSALRHLNEYRKGKREEDHLSAAIFNVAAIVHFEELAKSNSEFAKLLDIPSYIKEDE